jgi:chromosomal replication initiator protein
MSNPYVVGLDVGLLHDPFSGINASQLGIGPRNYAMQLARYIRDASTIRARTLSEWGRAPSLAECQALIASAQQERQRYKAESERLQEKDSDAIIFAPKATEQAVREQRRAAQKALLEKMKVAAEPAPANDQVSPDRPKIISEVIAGAANGMGVTLDALLSKSRGGDVLKARHVACYALRARGLSTPQIGSWLGRDHSTVVSSLRRFEAKATEQMRALAAHLIGKVEA